MRAAIRERGGCRNQQRTWKLRPKRKDTCWAQPRANISFTTAIPAISSSRLILSKVPGMNVACGTQQVPIGAGIPIHRHFDGDEAFYILDGCGTVILNDVGHPFEKGGTIFIPRHAWHGFANPDHELLLLWIVAPPGLDGFFRETCSPPGVPPKQLTREQVNQIARKYGTEYR
jgi:quercetin dioxygenase-like cupin family protein